jgi:hypothetical protein
VSTPLKIISYSVVPWIFALAICFIVPLPVISGFADLLSLLIGFSLFILALISLVKDKNRVLSLLAMVLVVITTWVAITRTFGWAARVHFQLNRASYEARVSKVLAVNDKAEREKICGDECWIMSGNSNRVSFHYVHGYLDWQDFVYDPTGEVMQQDFRKQKEVNTYLIRAEHIDGNWYLVYFGD